MDSEALDSLVDSIIQAGNLATKHKLFDFLSAICMPV